MAFLRKLAAGALAGCLLFSLAACTKKDEGSSGIQESTSVTAEPLPLPEVTANGRYVETDITPAGLEGTVDAMIEAEDGSIHVLASRYVSGEGQVYQHYRSENGGDSWEELPTGWTADYAVDYTGGAAEMRYLGYGLRLMPDGSIVTTVESLETSTFVTGTSILHMSADGQQLESAVAALDDLAGAGQSYYVSALVPVGGSRVLMQVTGFSVDAADAADGALLSGVYDLATGEEVFPLPDWNGGAYAAAGVLYAETNLGGWQAFDMAKGNVIANDTTAQVLEAHEGSGQTAAVFFDASGSLYTVGASGLREYNRDEATRLMETVEYGFGSPAGEVSSAVAATDGKLYVAGCEEAAGARIWRYVLDESLPAKAEEHLKVHALFDSDSVRWALYCFKQAQPEVTLEYTYTYSRTDTGVSAADAAGQMDMLIGAAAIGDGADVLVLDGAPLDGVAVSGAFIDLSALVGGGIASGAIEPLRQDGALYTLPTRYGIPLGFGSGESTSAQGLAEASRVYSLSEAVQTLYPLAAAALGSDATGYNEAAVQAALDAVAALANASRVELDTVTAGYDHSPVAATSTTVWTYSWAESTAAVSMIYSLDTLLEMTREAYRSEGMFGSEGRFEAKAAYAGAIGNEETWQPAIVVAVPARADTELAERFVASMLDTEVQSRDFGEGLPVNTGALEAQIAAYRAAADEYMQYGYGSFELSAADLAPRGEAFTVDTVAMERLYAAAQAYTLGTDFKTAMGFMYSED